MTNIVRSFHFAEKVSFVDITIITVLGRPGHPNRKVACLIVRCYSKGVPSTKKTDAAGVLWEVVNCSAPSFAAQRLTRQLRLVALNRVQALTAEGPVALLVGHRNLLEANHRARSRRQSGELEKAKERGGAGLYSPEVFEAAAWAPVRDAHNERRSTCQSA